MLDDYKNDSTENIISNNVEDKDIPNDENNVEIENYQEDEGIAIKNPNIGISETETELDDIDLLRKREDDNEVEYILKTNIFGRCSRKKVTEYVNAIREQQYKSEERFKKSLKEISDEKEELRKKWEDSQRYTTRLETQNAEFYEKVKKADQFDVLGYENEIKRLEDSFNTVLAEKKILENDNINLATTLDQNNKHIGEVELKYKEMTKRLLEIEKIDVNKERERISSLETRVTELTNELEKKDKDIMKYEKELEEYLKEFKNLKDSYESVVAANDNSKSVLIDSQKALLDKEKCISENNKMHEKQIEELSNQFKKQLSEIGKNLESAHNMIFERDQAIKNSNNSNQSKLVELESNYQIKLDSMMKNLLQKDDQINMIAKSFEEKVHISKLLENENVFLKKNADRFKLGLNEAMEKVEEHSKLNKKLMEELEEERVRNVSILKEKIMIEINHSAKEYEVNNLNYEVEILDKLNQKLTTQMEQERETAKNLITQFGTSRAVNSQS